jgi:hypothetical protein
MKQPKFTSGPWNYLPPSLTIRAKGCVVADVMPQGSIAEANATLIAAAPEMYEALEALLECADDFAKRVGWPDNKPREAARTALAKAGRA